MAGQLEYIEPVIAKRVKAVTTKIQFLWYQKIYVYCNQENDTYIMNFNGMYGEMDKFCLDPSAKCSSQKKNTSGLTYEISCVINHDKCLLLSCSFLADEMKFWHPCSSIICFQTIYFLHMTIEMYDIKIF